MCIIFESLFASETERFSAAILKSLIPEGFENFYQYKIRILDLNKSLGFE
jgi:hypothetical protein